MNPRTLLALLALLGLAACSCANPEPSAYVKMFYVPADSAVQLSANGPIDAGAADVLGSALWLASQDAMPTPTPSNYAIVVMPDGGIFGPDGAPASCDAIRAMLIRVVRGR